MRSPSRVGLTSGGRCSVGDPAFVCQHYEWAYPPGRKIDAATNVPGDDFRNRVANAGKPTTSPGDDDMGPWVLIRPEDGVTWYITDGIWKRWVNDDLEAMILVNNNLATWDEDNQAPWPWPRQMVEDLCDVASLAKVDDV